MHRGSEFQSPNIEKYLMYKLTFKPFNYHYLVFVMRENLSKNLETILHYLTANPSDNGESKTFATTQK